LDRYSIVQIYIFSSKHTLAQVLFRADVEAQPFAFGGEEGPEKFNPDIRYRGSLQNFLIAMM